VPGAKEPGRATGQGGTVYIGEYVILRLEPGAVWEVQELFTTEGQEWTDGFPDDLDWVAPS